MTKKRKNKGTGIQANIPYQNIMEIRKYMIPQGHSPTTETFSDISYSNEPTPNDDELRNQVQDTRFSKTELKEKILNIGLKALYGLIGLVILGALKYIYNHDIALNIHSEKINNHNEKIKSIESDVKENSTEINNLKTDKKLNDYRFEKLEARVDKTKK